MGSASDKNVNSCPRIHRTAWGAQNIPFIGPESVGRCCMHQQEKKKIRGNALMRTSKSEAILAISTKAPTYLHLQNNKLFHILQSPKPPPTAAAAAAGVTHQTRASSVSLLASAIPTGRNETEALLFMKASGCPLAWLLVFQSRSVRLANTKHMTDEDKERLAREKNRYRKASKGNLLSLSLSTSSRLQQS
jgi:hypothetical protein